MKRGKKAEEAAADGENDTGSGSVADGSSAAFFCPKCSFHHLEEAQVQQHIDMVHSVETEDDETSSRPLADEEGRFSCPDCEKSFKFPYKWCYICTEHVFVG